ncbi:MAG TPA: S8 family peptidase [Limnobacter sp.]|nr:S8 family peptidase [Limnobacter sp.]
MRSIRLIFSISVAVALCLAGASNSHAQHRLVIEFKDLVVNPEQGAPRDQSGNGRRLLGNALSQLGAAHRVSISMVRPFGHRGAVVQVADHVDVRQLIQRIESDPSVRSVAVDRRIRLHAQSPLVGLLNGLDPSRQSRSWFHQDIQSQPASINTGAMWTSFHGTSPTIVAVLDTGVLPSHPMLQGHLLPGYDFVTDPLIAADGQGISPSNSRDNDPSDPGDGVSFADLAADSGCGGVSVSSWHGTFVSGLIAGNPVPAEGVFSVNWNASIVPVRVLGKCGGFSSDLADGIRWAAGLPVPGAPANPFPARVINLSLGAEGACVASIEGAAIAEARQAGALVVVAAGNDGSTVDSPANCPGAMGIAAIDQEGLKASYSNFGPAIQLSAPGGDGAFPIWGPSNTGTSGPATNTYNTKVGTSFSAPMVSGAASLYLSLDKNASVTEVENALKVSARNFLTLNNRSTCTGDQIGVECNCTTSLCGAGMLDLNRLIALVRAGGLTNLFSNNGNVIQPGGNREFSSEGSFNSVGQTVNAVSFTLENIQKSDPAAGDPTLAISGLSVLVAPPAGVSGFDLRATVANGRSAVASITVANAGSTSPTLLASLLSPLITGAGSSGQPVPVGPGDGSVDDSGNGAGAGGGGGGGALFIYGLLALGALVHCFKRNIKQCVFIHE